MSLKFNMMAMMGVVLALSGCSRDAAQSADPCLSKPEARVAVATIQEMGRQLSSIDNCPARFPMYEEVRRTVGDVEGVRERVAVIEYMTDYLFSLDFSGLKYGIQARALYAIRLLVADGALGSLRPKFAQRGQGRDEYYKWRYDLLLKLLAWERKQIVRTVPLHRVKDLGFMLDPEKKDEYEGWNRIHYGGISHCEGLVFTMENQFHKDKRDMTEAVWNEIKVEIEAFFGRPLRTPAQLVDDAKNNRHVEFSEKEDDYAVPLPW